MSSRLRKKIQKKFKNRGYNLKKDALDEIIVFAEQYPDDVDGDSLDLLLDYLQEEPRMSNSLVVFAAN